MSTDPKTQEFRRRYEEAFDNRSWTEECQGVSHDDKYWYLSSNAKGRQAIVRLDSKFRVCGTVPIKRVNHGHIGDIDVKGGYVYGALEKPLGVLSLPTEAFDAPDQPGNLPRAYQLVEDNGGAPPQTNAPWCVYDELTERLYSSSDDDVGVVYAYRIDPARQRFVHDARCDCILEGNKLQHVQGGALTPNRNLIISSDGKPALHVYDFANGHYWGQTPVKRDSSKGEEVEGVDVRLGVRHAGQETQIHLILLDNDLLSSDDVIFKHYSVPEPSSL